ncbi:hypothetical protein CEXT_338261 [Caerostris extrusa]|uniref:Ycf15 n=1 Tax=Caerostris extrusa TaxID=172846 RepID=A0AAV4X2G5_CAEEX|nr:hypothetical protein CEXT_338261 [Caerostris extrusa]
MRPNALRSSAQKRNCRFPKAVLLIRFRNRGFLRGEILSPTSSPQPGGPVCSSQCGVSLLPFSWSDPTSS